MVSDVPRSATGAAAGVWQVVACGRPVKFAWIARIVTALAEVDLLPTAEQQRPR
jgi:hypothetical protein